MFFISLFLVIAGGISYDLLEEKVPTRANHFSYLVMAYSVTIIILSTYLIVSGYDFKNILLDINVYSFLVGISGMFADYGIIISYNIGWKLSRFNITRSIFEFVILLLVGFLFFSKQISDLKLSAVLLCIVSIFLINYKNIKHKERG
jgi:drug/metabolite transporter (DMT)-like permease